MKNSIFIAFVLIMFACNLEVKAQTDAITDISNAIKEANVEKVSKYFNSSIELTTDKGEEVYSQVQATAVLRDFFNRNPVRSYTVVHKGQKEGAEYVIGTYINVKGLIFRVYFFVKQVSGRKVIQDLRFEKD